MNLETYREEAPKTLNPQANTVAHFIDLICDEVSELANISKKRHYGIKPASFSRSDLTEELGDLSWGIVNLEALYRSCCERMYVTPARYTFFVTAHHVPIEEVPRHIRLMFIRAGQLAEHLDRLPVEAGYYLDPQSDLVSRMDSWWSTTMQLVHGLAFMASGLVATYELTWPEIFAANIHKLQKKRYVTGQFTQEHALDRLDKTPRRLDPQSRHAALFSEQDVESTDGTEP